MDSVSFDLAFEDFSSAAQNCPPISKIFSIKIFAISKTQKLMKCITDIDFNKVKKDILKSKFYKMEAIKIDIIDICENSTIIMGHYGNSGSPPSFFTVNLTYIDLLKSMTGIKQILNAKYCDIDNTFGLHDYDVNIVLRNQNQSFFTEVFRKVFTNFEKLDKQFHNSPYKNGSNKLSTKG